MKKLISIALALLMIAVMLPVMAMAADENTAVAKLTVGEAVSYYDTLVDAVKAAINKADAKIDVLKSSDGDGIVVFYPEKLDLTIDFHGHTYNVSGKAVGSSGTVSQAWHIEKESKLTLMNGTLEASSTSVAMLVQNYSNLTLDNMVLNTQKTGFAYVMSNNNGNVVIKDTTIFAADGKVAFDVCRYADYTGPSVTVEGNSVINGKVEISSSAPKDGAQHRLIISGGTFNGPIVKDGNNPDFLSNISGGVFVSDIVPFTGNSAFVVKDNNTGLYYAGGDAETVISEAESGSFTVLTNYHSELTVNPGVSITNGMPEGTFTVNGQVLNPGETHPTPSDGSSVTVRVPETISGDGAKNPTTGASSTGNVAVATAVVLLVSAAVVIRKK